MTVSATPASRPETVYTVSRLNREARFLLNDCFGTIWIEGEISNLSIPSSGHLYFSLKDAEAQVRCAMFRGQSQLLDFKPENGDHVLIKAQVSLYEPRGDFQLIVEYMEETGDGLLLRAFEALKQRLAAEGLFDARHKKPIPELPRCIGLITSPTGAAVHDVLTVLKRRYPTAPVIVFPVKVQGTEAKQEIVNALATADRLKLCDVLIVARGGGSLEDLWAFNEEIVARAIFKCETPVVTGIGHEIDSTIADFVADLRAPTPSAAAEAVAPDSAVLLARFQRLDQQICQRMKAILERHRETLRVLGKRLRQEHPSRRLQTQNQRLDQLELRLGHAIRNAISKRDVQLRTQLAILARHQPQQRLRMLEMRRSQVCQRLFRAIQRVLEKQVQHVSGLAEHLQAVSPLATLTRGYAVASRSDTGKIIRSVHDIQANERMETRIADGILISRIEETHKR
ncbi:exodeoxyribonuclease VII large subunit [Methylocaldum szegediense]|uniref:Exodeoxyribonuclease 7 large subunit n=1 Tax=Methylocaldum szegediense TaxID=73780 RepID=A0ABM9HX26_9GAMM|nr:exodeoxyribonuclease VII large subunit [Methylocaldum szegediense]CAI8742406.1 Exodeoxyribonuclease 7 large subunit [Methylocaldum szegediense]